MIILRTIAPIPLDCVPLAARLIMSITQQFSGVALPLGRAVQVDPIRPRLKAPGTKRLKLKYDGLL
jgi:hypothetical protein